MTTGHRRMLLSALVTRHESNTVNLRFKGTHAMDTFTYTTEFAHPLCPFCSARVPCDIDDPAEPCVGTCLSGHTATYQLDVED